MKTYKVNLPTKIFTTLFFVFLVVLFIYVEGEFHKVLKVFYYSLSLIFIFPFYCLYTERIVINDIKIDILSIPIQNLFRKKPFRIKKSLSWNEIVELRANFILYPESPIIILEPRGDTRRRRMEILIGGMGGMDLDLLRDILAHLPPNTKIDLYPHLEKMLQRKPDSKRKVIAIVSIISSTVVAGFLLTWFKFGDIAIILSIIVLISILIATSIWHK